MIDAQIETAEFKLGLAAKALLRAARGGNRKLCNLATRRWYEAGNRYDALLAKKEAAMLMAPAFRGTTWIEVMIDDCPTCNGEGHLGRESAPGQEDATYTCPTCSGRKQVLLNTRGVIVGIAYNPPAEYGDEEPF